MKPVGVGWQHLVAGVFAGLVFTVLYWAIVDNQPPYDRLGGHILPESPAPGDFVEVRWDIKFNRWCPQYGDRNVSRQIVDSSGKRHDYDDIEGMYSTQQKHIPHIVRGFVLPQSMPSGTAIYSSSACFYCNPWQHYVKPLCIREPKIEFTVRNTDPFK